MVLRGHLMPTLFALNKTPTHTGPRPFYTRITCFNISNKIMKYGAQQRSRLRQ